MSLLEEEEEKEEQEGFKWGSLIYMLLQIQKKNSIEKYQSYIVCKLEEEEEEDEE